MLAGERQIKMPHPLLEGLTHKDSNPTYKKGHRGRVSANPKPNKQKFVSQGEAKSFDPDVALHNSQEPNLNIVKEKPEHRFIAILRAQGYSLKDIFVQMGGELDDKGQPKSGTGQYSYPWLSQINRQPWFTRQVTRMLEESGKDKISARLEAEAMNSVDEIVRLRDEAESEQVRCKAAQDLLDRHLGKATQRVESKAEVTHAKVAEEDAAIDRQIHELERQLGMHARDVTPVN